MAGASNLHLPFRTENALAFKKSYKFDILRTCTLWLCDQKSKAPVSQLENAEVNSGNSSTSNYTLQLRIRECHAGMKCATWKLQNITCIVRIQKISIRPPPPPPPIPRMVFHLRSSPYPLEFPLRRVFEHSFVFSAGSNFNCDVNSTFTGMGENISLQNPFAFLPEIFFFLILHWIKYTFCGHGKFSVGPSNTKRLHALYGSLMVLYFIMSKIGFNRKLASVE